MKKLHILIVLLFPVMTLNAQVSFSGNSHEIITEVPEKSTGLDAIYILSNFDGVTIEYNATTSSQVTWYHYKEHGGGYAEEVLVNRSGQVSSLSLTGTEDMGYIIEEGTNRTYIWVVDYSKHQFMVSSLNISPEQECDVATLIPYGQGDKITYYTINGAPKVIDRDIRVTYNTLAYDKEQSSYIYTNASETFPFLSETLRVPAPLCNTEFMIRGDKFLEKWGISNDAISQSYTAVAVYGETWAVQAERNNDNEKKEDVTSLGGSAPVDITFSAAVTDAAIFKEWQISKDAEFNVIDTRYNDTEFDYTFTENGTTYIRFVASNNDASCDYYSETYEVYIGESQLDCPNAFSPYGSEGINDEWKVSYKSIISFECHIFNRWGTKIIEFTDPSLGWDGKYNGKLVPSGVYFYVIKAVGADGREYNLSGDINILKSKNHTGSSEDAVPLSE